MIDTDQECVFILWAYGGIHFNHEVASSGWNESLDKTRHCFLLSVNRGLSLNVIKTWKF